MQSKATDCLLNTHKYGYCSYAYVNVEIFIFTPSIKKSSAV
jgi:hypothetical protein